MSRKKGPSNPKQGGRRPKPLSARVRPRKNHDGKTISYVVDFGQVKDKRIRRSFRTRAEADACVAKTREACEKYGMEFCAEFLGNLPMYERILDKLRKQGLTLKDLTKYIVLAQRE